MLNLITSFSFLFTSIHSYKRNYIFLTLGCILCLITSIIYHGSLLFYKKISFITRIIDMVVAHSCIVLFLYNYLNYHPLNLITLGCIIYIFLVYSVFKKSYSKKGDLWHSSIHIVSNIGISCMIEAYRRYNKLKVR